jgi:hypothetical protein
MNYTSNDHKKADKANSEWMKKENSPVGDYMTHLNAARRERTFSTPLAQRLYGKRNEQTN